MKVSFIFLLAVVTVAVTFADEAEDEELWKNFKVQYGKKHKSKHEAKRKSHFIETDKKIKKHNKGNRKWKMVHNKFSDMTVEEKQGFLGVKVPYQIKTKKLSSAREIMSEERLDNLTYPASLDLREDKCLIPPKNQGQCGSCWAFSATTSLEFQACKKSGNPISFSEQQVVDCTYFDGRNGCQGGMYTNAWTTLLNNGTGMLPSANYSYVSGTSVNGSTTSGKCQVTEAGGADSTRVKSWAWTVPFGKNETIQSALVKYGPIPVAMNVIDSFYNFGKGIYDDVNCNSANYWDINHAVVVVGYGTDLSGTNYWIVRNSWGIFWGDGGYFYIKRGVNQCQIEGLGAYVVVK